MLLAGSPTTPAAYSVHLDAYQGPLDLLLYLVRRNEVDILDLPVRQLARQFLEYVEILELLDLDSIGDFVVLASSLMEIKSRLVLPGPVLDETTAEIPLAEDPRSELIERLLEYRRIRDAAAKLDERAAQWQRRYPRLSVERPSTLKDHAADAIKEVELWDLVSALSRVLHKQVVEQQAKIRYDETPIATYVSRIRERVATGGRVAFSEFFEGNNQRSRIIGVFLAILELLRHHGYRAEQPDGRGEIFVMPPLAGTESTSDSTPAEGATSSEAPATTTTDGSGEGQKQI